MRRDLTCFLVGVIQLLVLTGCAGPLISAGATSQSLDTTTASGWVVIGIDGKLRNEQLSAVMDPSRHRNVLQWRILRRLRPLTVLANPIPTGDLESIDLDVWSQHGSVGALQLEDVDHAKFHYPVKLSANSWVHVVARPADFRINDDSVVKKPHLDPAKLGNVVVFLELGSQLKAQEDNLLRFDNMRLTRNAGHYCELPEIVSKPMVVDHDVVIQHPLKIVSGGKLTLKGNRVKLASSIDVAGGALLLDTAGISAEGRFPHALTITVSNGGNLEMKGCHWHGQYMSAIDLESGSRASMQSMEFAGSGLTTTMSSDSEMSLNAVTNPGEFVLMPGCHLTAINSKDLLFWLAFQKQNPADISIPDGHSIQSWRSPEPSKINLEIKDCRDVLWGIVCDSDSQLRVVNSKLRAVGLLFSGSSPVTISGVKNKAKLSDQSLHFTDRKLEFSGSTVEAWNFYPNDKAQLTISDCTFGELMSFGNAQATVTHSQCDGTGGYIRSRGLSRITITDSIIHCPVISADASKMTLGRCTLDGTATASNHSLMTLTNCHLAVPCQRLDDAELEQR